MQIVSSYGVEIKKKNIPLRSTLDIFRKAVSYLIPVYAETWEELSEIRNPQKRFNEAEHLVHETKKNHARFAFDRHFPKMPSYLRRSAIQHALGAVSSYYTRLDLWEKENERENQSWSVRIMRCRYSIGMSCIRKQNREKMWPI